MARLAIAVSVLLGCGLEKPPPTPPVLENRAEPRPLELAGECLSKDEVTALAADGGRVVELDLGPRATGLVVRTACVLSCRHDIYALSNDCAVHVGTEYASHVRALPRTKNGLKVLQLANKSPGSMLEWEVVFNGTSYACNVERVCRCRNEGALSGCKCESWRPCASP